SELLGLYSGARARGLSLDLGAVQSVGAGVAARLFPRHETFLFRYDVRDQVLRGGPVMNLTGQRAAPIEIPLALGDVRRSLEVDQRHVLAHRLGEVLGRPAMHVSLIGQSPESCALLAIVGPGGRLTTPAEADLVNRFGDFLALSFAGAQLYKEVLDLSAIDGLTGLYNHRFFHERLRDEVARAGRYAHPVSLLFCDIDDFKGYNDRNGHAAGDAVLSTLGKILRNEAGMLVAFRESDVRARYGGEEVAVLLPETRARRAGPMAAPPRRAGAGAPFPGPPAPP